jgi:hypothetical protein
MLHAIISALFVGVAPISSLFDVTHDRATYDAAADALVKDLGSATNSKARSDVPTHAMYRPIGITFSRRYTNVTRANALIADGS